MPLLVTLPASDLNNGNTGPACLLFDIFCTVSTTIELVSCAPLSAKSAPGIDSIIYFLQSLSLKIIYRHITANTWVIWKLTTILL